MKVALKSVLKSSDLQFECFEDQQIIFRSGNMLCIKEISRGECHFISLQKHIDHLYSFKVAINKKGVYVAQKHQEAVQICLYSLDGERKAFNLTNQSLFFSQLESLQLLIDQYDTSLLYGAAKFKENSCVFLLDMSKMKLMAMGYLPAFEDIKVDSRDNMTLSVCGYSNSHNYVKCLRYGLGQWEIGELLFKKVQDQAIQHEIIMGKRIMFVTRADIFIFEEHELLQTLNLTNGKRSIVEVLRVPKGIIVRFDDQSLKLMIEDSDEITFMDGGTLQLELLPKERIFKMATTHNLEEVVIRSTKRNVYIWRCQHLSSTTDKSELIFNRIYNSCNFSEEGSISISTGKKYCLLIGSSNVTIWSIEKNEIVLSSDFTSPEDASKKVLFAGAINPDGNSILLAFEDKVRLYSILFTKLKLITQFNIKRCQSILYSHGGQLAACRFGKSTNACVTIVNMVRCIEVCTFKVQSQPKQFVWNELDDELIVSTQANALQIFRISENTKIHHIKIPEQVTQVRIDYKTKQIIVSSQRQIFIIEGGKIVQKISPPIQNFYYLFPLYGVYFIATKTGELVWSYTSKFETYHEIPLFSNKTFHLVCRNSYLLAFSSFQDIAILQCERQNHTQKKLSGQDIVMIERDEILSFFDKVKVIENSFDILANATQIKVQEEKNRYEKAIEQHQQLFQKEIKFLNSKLHELNTQKLKQQKENEKTFNSLQIGQIKSINDLEKMYDRKYEIQKEKYLNLQQTYLQQKLRYEKLVLDVQQRYHREVSLVREQYTKKINEQCNKIEEIKNTGLDNKIKMQMKIIDLQQENEVTLGELQNSNENNIRYLLAKYSKLEEEYEQTQILMHNQQSDLQRLGIEAKEKRAEAEAYLEKVRAFESRVLLLEKQIARKNIMIQQRNQIIDEQAHQIGGLEKAKYVLSFRTTEIRKELQPKEEQVDKLKSQMFKMEEEFKEEKKKNHNLFNRVEKLQRINQIQKREIGDLRISLKHKQRLYEELCSEIFTIINNIDPKEWNAEFIKIYQNYIKQNKYEGRTSKKKDDTTQEINRHLIHVEESLIQVTSGTEKLLKGKEKEVMRKMKENSELVYELNVMRKKENQFIKERKELFNENARLKRELNQSAMKSTTRSQTAYTGFTRRVIASRDGGTREKSLNLEIQDLEKSKAELKSSRNSRNRLVSARRTLLMQDDKKQKQSKIFDIARQLQTARTTIKRQDRMIEQLNQRLMGGPLDQ